MKAPALYGLAALAVSAPAFALTPAEVFEKVAPSVWAVRGLDAQERPFSYGSAVVIGPGRLVTNCHVLAKAKSIQLRRENVTYEGKLEHADAERDLCILSAANFTAPAVRIASFAELKVGQRVYAIGNPEKLALTLSEGLISGLRSEDPKLPPIQTTAPISPGSSGGGLFDERARLVGITTGMIVGRERIAQNLNFAMPAEWLNEVPERAKEQLAKRRERQQSSQQQASVSPKLGSPASDALPSVGAAWKYSFKDRQFRHDEQLFTVQVTGVDGWMVRESFKLQNAESGDDAEGRRVSVNTQELRFNQLRIGNGHSVLELAPYLLASELGRNISVSQIPANYPSRAQGWQIKVTAIEPEEITVPAGTYKTTRVEVTGYLAPITFLYGTVRFHYTAWYAPEVNRYVMVRHRAWDGRGTPIGDEVVQLVEYRPN